MKLQCDLCREIVVADFAISGAAIDVLCPACTKSFQVTATRTGEVAPAPRSKRLTVGDATCPKCGDAQPEATACRTCGLLRERWGEWAADHAGTLPDTIEAAWTALEAGWSDAAAHDRFVELVAVEHAFPIAARRYRDALRARPDDRRAAEQLAKIARMAEATLFASAAGKKPATSPHPYRSAMMVVAAALVLIVMGFALATWLEKAAPDDHEGAPPPVQTHPAPRVVR